MAKRSADPAKRIGQPPWLMDALLRPRGNLVVEAGAREPTESEARIDELLLAQGNDITRLGKGKAARAVNGIKCAYAEVPPRPSAEQAQAELRFVIADAAAKYEARYLIIDAIPTPLSWEHLSPIVSDADFKFIASTFVIVRIIGKNFDVTLYTQT